MKIVCLRNDLEWIAGLGAVASEFAFERFDVGANMRIRIALSLDLAHGAHDGRVIAVAESPSDFWERNLQTLLAQIHRDVAGKSDALVAIF